MLSYGFFRGDNRNDLNTNWRHSLISIRIGSIPIDIPDHFSEGLGCVCRVLIIMIEVEIIACRTRDIS